MKLKDLIERFGFGRTSSRGARASSERLRAYEEDNERNWGNLKGSNISAEDKEASAWALFVGVTAANEERARLQRVRTRSRGKRRKRGDSNGDVFGVANNEGSPARRAGKSRR